MNELIFSIYQYIFALTVLFDLIVFIMAFVNRKNILLHKLFLTTVALMVIWESALFLTFFTISPDIIDDHLNRVAFGLGPLIVLFIFLFLEEFLGAKVVKGFMRFGFIILAAISSLVTFAGFVVGEPIYSGTESYQYILPVTPLLTAYYLSYFPVTIGISYAMWRIFRDVTDYRKRQARYVIFALLVSFALATGTNIWFPLFYRTGPGASLDYNNYILILFQVTGTISVTIWTSVTAYAIARHRLLSLHIVVKRSLIFLTTYLVTIAAVLAVFHTVSQGYGGYNYFTTSLIVIISLLLIQPVHSIIRNHFWKEEYDLALKVNQDDGLNVMLAEYVLPALRSLIEDVQPNTYYLYTLNPDTMHKDIIEFGLQLPSSNPNDIIQLKRNTEMYLRNCDGIVTQRELNQFKEIHAILKKRKATVIIPFANSDTLYGMLLLDLKDVEASQELLTKYQATIKHSLYMALNLYYVQRRRG